MFDCVSKTPLLPVMKKKLCYMILHDFINCPVFTDVKQTFHHKVAIK